MSRVKLSWLAPAVVALLPMAAAASDLPVVSLHELKMHWQNYDGKRVQVTGQLDACGPVWFCAICPEDMTSDSYDWNKCIAFSFEDQHKQNMTATDATADTAIRKKYRFNTVTVEANFSALCFDDESGKPVGDVVCSDGPANLDNARILMVRSRKNALEGLGEIKNEQKGDKNGSH
jgi:hypothetical protein